MSIVVAATKNGRTAIAADSLTLFGESQTASDPNSVTLKVRRIGAALVGSAGWGVYDMILDNFLADRAEPDLTTEQTIFSFFVDLWQALHDRYTFVNDQASGKDSPFGDLDTSFLIASTGGIFKVSNDLDVCRFHQYWAIGSGADYALGAMHTLYDQELDAEALVRRATETAIQFDVHCGGQVTLLSLDNTWRVATAPSDRQRAG
jgi:ATP-dependent protease HslVU (ClpYQ) peptidase subunit